MPHSCSVFFARGTFSPTQGLSVSYRVLISGDPQFKNYVQRSMYFFAELGVFVFANTNILEHHFFHLHLSRPKLKTM